MKVRKRKKEDITGVKKRDRKCEIRLKDHSNYNSIVLSFILCFFFFRLFSFSSFSHWFLILNKKGERRKKASLSLSLFLTPVQTMKEERDSESKKSKWAQSIDPIETRKKVKEREREKERERKREREKERKRERERVKCILPCTLNGSRTTGWRWREFGFPGMREKEKKEREKGKW